MALTLSGAITTAEAHANQRASIRVTFSDEILRWSLFTQQSTGTLDINVPANFLNHTTQPYAYATHRRTDGKAWITQLDKQTGAHWALPLSTVNSFAPYQLDGSGASTQYHNMRYGLRNESGTIYVYAALHNGSGVRIYKGTPGSSLSTCGSAFGPTFVDTSSQVRRVEAVCPTSDGSVIIAVGTYDFDGDFAVINFWWAEPSCGAAHQLDAAIHYAGFTETYSNWYSAAKWACCICAEYDSVNDVIRVIANAHPAGQAVEFSVIRGASTPVRPILPIDPRYGSTTFRPASIQTLNGLFLLTGRYTFSQADGTAVDYDCFLTSADGLFWSFGERNFYLQHGASAGAILPDTSSTPVSIYYGGNGYASITLGTPQFGYNTSTKQLDAAPLPGWNLTQGVNGPNPFTFSVIDDDGTLLNSPLLTRGTTVYLTAGQWSTFDDIAAFTIDAPAERVSTEQGREAVRVTARDLGNKSLARHNLMVALDYRGVDVLSTDLGDLTGLVLKTRSGDVHEVKATDTSPADLSKFDHVFNDQGLEDKALNNPFIALTDLAEEPAWFQGFTIETPDTGDDGALPTFALLWGGTDEGFLGYIIPRASDWAPTKTKPRVALSNLRPFDATTGKGPYQFPDGSQGLWVANNYDALDADAKYLQAVTEEPDHYGAEGDFSQAAGAIRDYRLRRNGRRLQLLSRLHDYAPATVASRTWTPVSSYAFSDDACMEPAQRQRLGLAVNTDTYALLGRGLPPKRESQLSSAAEYEATYGFFVITGQVSNNSSTVHMVNADYQGAGLTVGMRILIDPTWGSNFFAYIVSFGTNTMDIDVTITGHANAFFDVYVHGTSSPNWGYADSGYRSIDAGGGATTQINPHADKQPVLVYGRGTFISDDATALSSRVVSYTGDHAELKSGNTERQTAWDETNPIAPAPQAWRLILPPNLILMQDDEADPPVAGWMSDLGFATAGYFKTSKKEIVRYVESEIASPGGVPGDNPTVKLTLVPTYYAALQGQTEGLSILTQLDVDGHVVGDNWMFIGSGTITDGGANTDPARLRVEITSKSGGTPLAQRYITGVDWKDSGDHALGGYVSLDKPIQGFVRDATGGAGSFNADSGDLAIFDGRAQLGTQFADDPGGVLIHYPAAASTTSAVSAFVNVSHYTAQTGRYRSVEDAIYHLCALAGVRSPIFRTLMNSPYEHMGVTWEITTTPQALPLVMDLQDFDLRMNAHITDAARLYVDFRGLYRLSIREDLTTPGLVNIGLIDFTDHFGITASGGDKWIQKVDGIYIAPIALCATSADTVPLRVTAVDNLLFVEIAGVHAWTFDFSEFHDDSNNDYYVLQPGYIALSYSTTVADNLNTARVPELWMPIRPIVQAAGTNTASTLKTILDRYHVRGRMQPGGALEFAQFITRDDAGVTAQGLPIVHEPTSDDSMSAAYVTVIGEQSGGYLNENLLATEGFSYKTVSVEGLVTVAQAQAEAQVISRESAEFAEQATIEGLAKLADQPEDGKTLAYGTPEAPPADITPWFRAGGIDEECVLGAWLAGNAASYLDSIVDLSGNGHTLTVGSGTPNWNADDGWVFDRTWYLRTGVTVGSTWPSPTQSLLVCFDSLTGHTDGLHEGVIAGAIENWGVLFVGNTTSTANLQFGNMFTFQSDPGITYEGAGGTAIVAGDTLYWNATANKTETFGTTSFNGPAEAYIGAGNRHGAPFMPVMANVKAVVIYDCVLTPDQITAVTDALTGALSPAADSWWLSGGVDSGDVLFAYQPLCAEDFSASLVNLNDPGTSDATQAGSGAGVSFDPSYGWNFDDPLSWLDTHTTQGASFTSRTILVRVSANLDWGQFAAGMDVTGGDPLNLLINLTRVGSGPYTIGVWVKAGAKALSASSASPYDTGKPTDWDSGGGVPDPFPPTNDFIIGIANDKLYIDGVNVATLATSNTTGSTADVILGAADQSGGNVGPLIQAAVMYSRALTGAEMSAVSTAMLELSYPCDTPAVAGPSNAPTYPATGFVITQLTWNGQADSIRATYRIRRAWPITGPVTGPS